MNRFLQRLSRIVGSTAMLVALAAPAHAQWTVTIRDLGTLGGDYSVAFAVNDAGQAVGYSTTDAGNATYHATLWSGVTTTDLGTLCSSACGTPYSYALDINAAGQVVGVSSSTGGYARAFLWTGGVMTALPLPAGDVESVAYGINTQGQIAGYSSGPSGTRAVVWTGGTPLDLGVLGVYPGLGAYSIAYDINDAGQVVGASMTSSGATHGFVWTSGVMTDLGTGPAACDGDDNSFAGGINATGDISGVAYFGCVERAATWVGGVIEDLGSPGGPVSSTYSEFHGINDAGHVAGAWYDGTSCDYQGALWADGATVPLPALGASNGCSFGWAEGLNNSGQIAGYSSTATGHYHAVLWLAEPPDTTPPQITITASTDWLWPSSRKLVPVAFTGTISDAGSEVQSASFTTVDEYGRVQPSGPVTIGRDGSYQIFVWLEPRVNERDWNGRVYAVTVSATDVRGNHASASSTVTVRRH